MAVYTCTHLNMSTLAYDEQQCCSGGEQCTWAESSRRYPEARASRTASFVACPSPAVPNPTSGITTPLFSITCMPPVHQL